MHTVCFALKVLSDGEYRAEPADVWSCGIVLVAMLAGGKKRSCDLNVHWMQRKSNFTGFQCEPDPSSFSKIDFFKHPVLESYLQPILLVHRASMGSTDKEIQRVL